MISMPRSTPRWPLASTLAIALLAAICGGCAPQNPRTALARSNEAVKQTEIDNFNDSLQLLAAQAAHVSGEYKIGPEDLIEVTFYDIEDTAGDPRVVTARVSNSGFITLPYIGKAQAAGYDPIELEEALRVQYKRFIHEPQITVHIQEYRSFRVSVVGNVKTPGVLELRGRKTLLEALAMAGGLDPDAGRSVRLTRVGNQDAQSVLIDLDQLAQTGDARLNPSLVPGDVINVPKAGIFYVEGMVNKPGAYPLLTETTVTQALVVAGGVDFDLSRASGTTVYRKRPDGEREAIAIDIAAIQAGRAPDMVVTADDVIVVPMSGAKLVVDKFMGLFRVGVSAATF